jgi:class 3 adenylate cyclase
MRKGLRFQTKLMATLVAAITAVSLALVLVTENKVAQAYTRQFSREFTHLVKQLEESSEERSLEFLALSAKLAAHPFIAASLAGTETPEQSRDFWREYLGSLGLGAAMDEPGSLKRPDLPGGRGQSPQDLIARFGSVGIVSLSGQIRSLHPELPRANGRDGEKRPQPPKLRYGQAGINRAKKRIDDLLARDDQQMLYLPFENPEGQGFVQKMVSTPVKRSGSGETIGLFLRATSAETEAQRFLERYQEMFPSDSPLLSGIFLDGELYERHLDETIAAEMSDAVGQRLQSAKEDLSKDHLAFEASLGGVPHRIYVKMLPGDRTFEPAYQVSAYSLAPLKRDLAELRLRGSGIGAAALVLGLAIAWFFSHRLAVPIGELTRATRAIREGRLDTRLAVRTRDEIGELAESFNEMAAGLQQRDAYRNILEKVSDETVAQAMISGDLDLELGGELKPVTVLFCDIRGFTGLTEHMPPTEVIALLNEHMTAMTAVVRKHFGVVDKFVGDEVMGVFGALKSYGEDSAHAVACALEMVRERERLNRDARHPIEIGVGVATGEAVAGCMGSIDRLNYTVVGSRVNLASRLCSEAGPMEVVIDDQTLSGLEPDTVRSAEPIDLQLKGFSGAVSAYRLTASAHPAESVEPAART